MSWWLEKPMRLVQTNLREIDADLDIDCYIEQLKNIHADVVLFNVGGILANYPTELDCHVRNPYLKNDMVGEVISRTQKQGMRFIARFDFSKVHESLAAEHPQWLYVSRAGENINYNGQVHTCINGEYQQVKSLDILNEAIDRYPIDGVFFNMVGYVTTDYSGNFHGFCRCESCRKRFKNDTGHDLPDETDEATAAYQQYMEFRGRTRQEQFVKIHDFIKSKNPEIGISTYGTAGVDIVRLETNSAVDRPKPEWTYSSMQHLNFVRTGWDDKAAADATVHFVDFPYRHAAVSPNLTMLRLAHNVAAAAWLDFYVIGPLEKQEDRACLSRVRELFKFYADNESWYTHVKPYAKVCLIQPDEHHGREDFMGLIQLLCEEHILFNLLPEGPLTLDKLSDYDVVILPDMQCIKPQFCEMFDAYVQAGGKLLCTGFCATRDEDGQPISQLALSCLGVSQYQTIPAKRGAYLRVSDDDKLLLNGFDDIDILYLDGDLIDVSAGDVEKFLGYIPPYMFGPPEKCYYKEQTNIPGIIRNTSGQGCVAMIPWQIGRHFEQMGQHGHRALVMAALKYLLNYKPMLETEASELVTFTSHIHVDDQWQLLSLVNHSGQNRSVYNPPLPIDNIDIRLRVSHPIRKVHALQAGVDLSFSVNENVARITLPRLNLLETIVIEYS